MTKEEHVKFIEGKIQQCIEVQDMEMEKWAFMQCLKNARKLGQELPIHNVSNQRELLIGALKQYDKVKYEWNKLTIEDYVDKYHPNL